MIKKACIALIRMRIRLFRESANPSVRPSSSEFKKKYQNGCINLGMLDREPTLCGTNEVYDKCPPIYPPLRCNVKEVLTVCGLNPELGSPMCEAGCRCANNYYLNGSGECITEEECLSGVRPTVCNSRSPGYSECINGGCLEWRCTDVGYICSVKGPCEIGCACRGSYELSTAGICMPIEYCPASPAISEDVMLQLPYPKQTLSNSYMLASKSFMDAPK
ncbi:jg16499 [Pararge aegeria aegeria]|uniref:Jg16499 protein n=1 Tax=Pararge aegeria aegeria TaxID=348720 RepID=A0A8S4S9R8_9NEOP|nr:jg16499 [Pararge aegeria aegeria]